jgi:hypothetical protein
MITYLIPGYEIILFYLSSLRFLNFTKKKFTKRKFTKPTKQLFCFRTVDKKEK